jgi:hypothetical protein
VDGQIYAQPLYVANVAMGGGQFRNVVYVATEHNSVYAFDADAVPCQPPLWMKSFLDDVAGVTPVPSSDLSDAGIAPDIAPEIGITGTPVIDRASGTLYVVAKTKESTTSGPDYFQRLHALDIVTGSEKFGGPVKIAATALGNGDGTENGNVSFDPLLENQRAALQLINGKVYIAFTGHDPTSGFHGWLLVYDAAALAQVDVFDATPDRSRGGIIAAPSTDFTGNIYVATGHGAFDASPPLSGKDFGQTLLELSPPPLTITNTSKDSFTPSNQALLTANQSDFGATGVLILPDQTGAPNPHLATVGGTNGVLYLLNRDNLGGFASPGIKTLNFPGAIYGTPAYWQGTLQNTLYIAAAGDALKAFSLAGGTLADAASSQSTATFGLQGASPVVSSNGISGGVVWVLDTGGAPTAPAVLHAYDAANLAHELYNSAVKTTDAAGPAISLAVPTVANGKVYVGT